MAETDSKSLIEFIRSIAATGEALAASLLKFTSKWCGYQSFIPGIAVNTSIITNLLLDVAATIEKNGENKSIEENTIHTLCEGIKADFEKIVQALERADLNAGPGYFVTKTTSRFRAVRNNDAVELARESECDAGMPDQSFLNERLNGETLLKDELKSDWTIIYRLEEVKDHLWFLYEGFRYLTLRRLEKGGTIQPEEVEELKKLVEQLPTVLEELEYRKKSIVDAATESLKVFGVREQGANDHGVARRNMDDDARSIVSVNSMASDQFLDINEVYETWVIRKFEGEKNWPRRSWALGWFRVYEYYSTSGYEIDSQEMTPEQMTEQHNLPKTGRSKSEEIAEVIATLPTGVQQEIKYILEDRTRSSTNARFSRKWSIVDIEIKLLEPERGWLTWWRGQPEPFSKVLFIIKGETTNPNDYVKPVRNEDPFRKPQYRRVYYDDPAIRRQVPREVVAERRPKRQIPRRQRQGVLGQANGDRPETLRALSLEEAETKVLGIFTDIGRAHSDNDEFLVSDEVMV